MIHIYTEYVQLDYSDGVSPQQKGSRSLRNAKQHHMEDIMVYFAHKQKSGKVVSIGLKCMKTPRISFEDVVAA
jgi:hypothetical protein